MKRREFIAAWAARRRCRLRRARSRQVSYASLDFWVRQRPWLGAKKRLPSPSVCLNSAGRKVRRYR